MNEIPGAFAASRFVLNGQYVKDLSFENPGAPRSLFEMGEEKPKIDLGLDLKAQRLRDDFFELTLHVEVRAAMGDQPLFLVDLAYSGLVTLVGVPEADMERVLLAEVPYTLYPFARRVISDATRDGGFPPLLLDPIDFAALFAQSKQNGAAA